VLIQIKKRPLPSRYCGSLNRGWIASAGAGPAGRAEVAGGAGKGVGTAPPAPLHRAMLPNTFPAGWRPPPPGPKPWD